MNTIRSLDENLEEPIIVQKVLRSLPKRFNPKVSTIEEMTNTNTHTLDQLLGTLTAYEMRISKGKPTTKESTFKADKNLKEEHDDSFCELDEEEEKFVRKLKGGSGKYKGKLPFKCFNCG